MHRVGYLTVKGKGLLLLGEPSDDGDEDEPKAEKPSGRVSAVKALKRALDAEDWAKADEALALHTSLCAPSSEDEDY